MRNGLLAVLLCAAVGVSALPVYRIWRLPREQGKADLSLTELENGSVRFALEYTGEYPGTVDITKQEAAELGRALLEAAGQPEKVCPSIQFAPYNNGETKVCTCNSVVGGLCDCWNVGDVKP